MAWTWGEVARRSGKWVMPGWLIVAAVIALYFGLIVPRDRYRGMAEQRETGLSAVAQNDVAPASSFGVKRIMGAVAVGNIGGSAPVSTMVENGAPPMADDSDRKMVRTASLDLVVQHPAESAEKVRALAQRLGGYLESSEVTGDPDVPGASLTIRVPADRFEEARAEIRKLGLRVESEKTDAQDVTKQYVDQDARLRNLRAQEEQYLGILKHAATVKDTLEVSEKINEVRGEIEQQQAEFDALRKQTETVAITVSLRAEADAQVFGLHWRPLYRLKMAAREGLDGLGDYIATMTALVFYLPTILLWFVTILIGAALGWRILRWSWRVLFRSAKPALSAKEAN